MTLENRHWFNELNVQDGSAFSLKYTAKLYEEQTSFQKIEVYQTEGFGNLMVIDGFIMLTQRDNLLYHEMMAHPVLFTHPAPRRVLIIGGGDCGTLREVLRHPDIETVDQVDIDEGVTRAAEKFFPELRESNGDPRAGLHFADGLKWVKEAVPGSYDIIIVDSTDAIGPAEGLFGINFYRDCLTALGNEVVDDVHGLRLGAQARIGEFEDGEQGHGSVLIDPPTGRVPAPGAAVAVPGSKRRALWSEARATDKSPGKNGGDGHIVQILPEL